MPVLWVQAEKLDAFFFARLDNGGICFDHYVDNVVRYMSLKKKLYLNAGTLWPILFFYRLGHESHLFW